MIDFELSKPISIDTATGMEPVRELKLDFDALSLADMKAANKIKGMLEEAYAGTVTNGMMSERLDSNFRIAIAWMAAMKTDSRLSSLDILKVSVADGVRLAEESLTSYFFV